MGWAIFAVIALIAAYVAIDRGTGAITDRLFDPLMKRAKAKAGVPVKDQKTGEERVPWVYRPVGKKAGWPILIAVCALLALFGYWLG
jgi:hypothetical protein